MAPTAWQIPASFVGAVIGCVAAVAPAGEGVHRSGAGAADLGADAGGDRAAYSGLGAPARRRGGRSAEHVSRERMAALVFATFAVGIYGGYFTAAQGILLMGAMGALLPEDMQRMNAAKNLLSLVVNVVAAVAYMSRRVRPDQLAGGGTDRGGFADRRVHRRALRTSAVAQRAARGDRRGRPDRVVPAADPLERCSYFLLALIEILSGVVARLGSHVVAAVGFRPAAGDPGSTAGCGAVW